MPGEFLRYSRAVSEVISGSLDAAVPCLALEGAPIGALTPWLSAFLPVQGGAQTPASPKKSTPSHLIGKYVSPGGNPPPRAGSRPSRPSSLADGQTPRSLASEATNFPDLSDATREVCAP